MNLSSSIKTTSTYRREVGSTFNSFVLTNIVERVEQVSTSLEDRHHYHLNQHRHQQHGGNSISIVSTRVEDLFPKMDEPLMQILRWLFVAVYAVLFFIGFSNILALFIVGRFPRMQTVTNIFIFNLCLADFVYVLFLPFVITFRIKRTWMFGGFFCKLFYIAESTAKYASVYFVCVLSVDRYLALCYPGWCKRYRTLTLSILVSVLGWVTTAALMTPIYLYSQVIEVVPTLLICGVKWPDAILNVTINGTTTFTTEHYYTIYSFVFCFATPALIIIIFYFKVFEQLLQASDRAERLKKRKEQSYKRVTRMVLAMVTFYFICWTPYWVMYFVNTFALTRVSTAAIRILFNIIHILPYLNCALNPILYGLMTQTFIKILKEMFPCCFCCTTGKTLGKICCCRRGRRTLDGHKDYHSTVQDPTTLVVDHRPGSSPLQIEDDEDSVKFVKTSISTSVQLMSNLCLNLLGRHELTALVNQRHNTCSSEKFIVNGSMSPKVNCL